MQLVNNVPWIHSRLMCMSWNRLTENEMSWTDGPTRTFSVPIGLACLDRPGPRSLRRGGPGVQGSGLSVPEKNACISSTSQQDNTHAPLHPLREAPRPAVHHDHEATIAPTID